MNIRRIILPLACICLLASGRAEAKKDKKEKSVAVSTTDNPKLKGWKFIWSDEFNGTSIDENNWSPCEKGSPDWKRHMSPMEGLREVKDGSLHLYGICTPEGSDDNRPYLTGGVHSKGKQSIKIGRIDVRARFDCAQGFWPAIWLMPDNDKPWPTGGEIDIMEHLNHDDIAYQTVHSTFTKSGEEPKLKSSATGPIDKDGFNVYTVLVTGYGVEFYINGQFTNAYPRLFPDREGQYPFVDHPFYVILSAQLGGNWVGEIDPKQLPVEMEIDYVRFYKGKSRGMK